MQQETMQEETMQQETKELEMHTELFFLIKASRTYPIF